MEKKLIIQMDKKFNQKDLFLLKEIHLILIHLSTGISRHSTIGWEG